MKLIAITARIPILNSKGDQLIAYNRIIHLAKIGHKIELICFGSNKKIENRKAKEILEKNGINVHLIKWNFFEAFFNILKSFLFDTLPLQCAFYKSKKLSKKIKHIYQNNQIDLIYCVMIRVVPNIEWYKGKLLIDVIDSMGLNFLRRYKKKKSLMKWILKKEKESVSKYEKNIINKSYISFVVSSVDQKYIGSKNVKVLPIGVNIYGRKRKINKDPILIFTGNMSYDSNIESIIWFIKYCWSNILIKEPKSKLYVVGNNPSAALKSISKKFQSIIITGKVISIYKYINKATVAIAPMQSGSGMQNKILEAMACGIPVVSTSLGVGDIKAVKNRDLLVADDPKSFSDKVVLMIKSKDLNHEIGNNGLKHVEINHNWESINNTFVKLSNLIKKNIIIN